MVDQTFTMALEAYTTYNVEIEWSDGGGPGNLFLYWDYGTGSSLITSTSFGVYSDISSSPYQTSIE